jgi:hypothetical protein
VQGICLTYSFLKTIEVDGDMSEYLLIKEYKEKLKMKKDFNIFVLPLPLMNSYSLSS